MLLINGYTRKFTQWLGLTPAEGRLYWANGLHHPVRVLKDWNLCFVHPASSAFSSAKDRFHCGYDFAHKHEKKIREHILLSGNALHLVAHSHGVAFAEGIAAYMHEEKGIQADLLVALQGAQAASTPQCRGAVQTRISLRTKGDIVANKFEQQLRLTNIAIEEEQLPGGFIRYEFFMPNKEDKSCSALYFKGKLNWRTAHIPHRCRQFSLWEAVRHAIQLNEASLAENAFSDRSPSSRLSGLIRQANNQN